MCVVLLEPKCAVVGCIWFVSLRYQLGYSDFNVSLLCQSKTIVVRGYTCQIENKHSCITPSWQIKWGTKSNGHILFSQFQLWQDRTPRLNKMLPNTFRIWPNETEMNWSLWQFLREKNKKPFRCWTFVMTLPLSHSEDEAQFIFVRCQWRESCDKYLWLQI